MKLYVLKYGNQYFSKAYTDQKMAERVAEDYNAYTSKHYRVNAIDLPFVGRSVCYVHAYYGYDYNYFNDGAPIVNRCESSHIYSCTDMAKTDFIWRDLLCRAQINPSKHIITDTKIASRDNNGKEFTYGDCFENLFNVAIHRIRVIKEKY
jgi:hypothetical protein